MNGMDTTYRADLRELNELNFARFDAKLEQRVAEVRSELAELRVDFRVALEAQTRTLLKWMLGFWVATVPSLAGVIVVVQHFLSGGRP